MAELTRRKGRRGMSDEKKNRIIALYKADELTVPEIARACQVSPRSVFRIIANERGKSDNVTQEDGRSEIV